MAVWETKRIKHCAKLSPPCDTSKLLPDSEVTFTPMECIKNGYFLNRKAPFSTVNGSYTQYQEGDIVIAKVTPCFENGNIAEMSGLYSGFGFGSSELFVLRPYSIQPRFLFYALQSEDFKKKGCATMTGTGGLKRVSPAFIANYQIAVPQPDEQKRIAKFLDKKCAEIDAVLDKTRISIEEYKKLKQAIITQAVTKGVRGDRPMKESGIEWVPTIPADWEIIPSKRLFADSDERKRPDDELLTASQKYGVISQQQYMEREKARVVLATQGIENWKHVEPYDFIISLRSFQGGLEMSEVSGCITWHYIVLKPLRPIHSFFFKWLFKSELYIKALQRTCNFIRDGQDLRYSNFVQAPLFIPPMEEQKEIAGALNVRCAEIDALIQKKVLFVAELESYKKSLIYEYVTGKKEASQL